MNIFRLNLLFSISIALYTIINILNYNKNSGEYYLCIDLYITHFYTKLDTYNLLFLILTILNHIICVSYIQNNSKFSVRGNLFFLFFITICLLLSFSTSNILIFLFFFESLLIPLIFFVGILGSRSRKISAVYFLFFFTILSSIFLIIGCFFLYKNTNNLNFSTLLINNYLNEDREMIIYLFFLGFISKIPMMPLHIWLPEVHVEASTVGSVILAAIILKIGFYGLIRIFETIGSYNFTVYFYQIFALFCLCSLIYGGLVAVRQIDLKKIVAYSSIVHMNIGMLGICNISMLSHIGSLFIMFSHGLISSAMFLCVGFLYERFHTRNIMYYGGLIQYMPIFGIFFVVVLLSNMSLPGTCNFIGEFIVFFSLVNEYGKIISLCCLGSTFFTSVFCILIFGKVLFYKVTGFFTNNLRDINNIEFTIIINLIYLIICFGIFPNLLIEIL